MSKYKFNIFSKSSRSVIMALAESNNHAEGITLKRLLNKLDLSEYTTVRALRALKSSGYIEKIKTPHSPTHTYRFTESGKEMNNSFRDIFCTTNSKIQDMYLRL